MELVVFVAGGAGLYKNFKLMELVVKGTGHAERTLMYGNSI